MPWARLDDRFHENRKVRKAWKQCPAAIGLHVLAITYCAGHLTDGVVDEEFVEERMPVSRMRARAIQTLTGCGLWFEIDSGTVRGWQINDFAEYNQTRADVDEKRRSKSEAGKLGASKRWGNSTPIAGAIGVPMADGDALPFQGNAPTRPDPNLSANADIYAAFEYWQQRCKKPRAKLTSERRAKVKARLDQGYSLNDIKAGIDGAAINPPTVEGTTYDDLISICRNGAQLERYIERAVPKQPKVTPITAAPSAEPKQHGPYVLAQIARHGSVSA